MTVAIQDGTGEWVRRRVGAPVILVLRWIGVALSVCLMIVAVPLFIMPIPLGIPLFIVALILLAASSKSAHGRITRGLRRHPRIWRRVKGAFGE
jgi:hypothetical protein